LIHSGASGRKRETMYDNLRKQLANRFEVQSDVLLETGEGFFERVFLVQGKTTGLFGCIAVDQQGVERLLAAEETDMSVAADAADRYITRCAYNPA
jgi:hypothetical protein